MLQPTGKSTKELTHDEMEQRQQIADQMVRELAEITKKFKDSTITIKEAQKEADQASARAEEEARKAAARAADEEAQAAQEHRRKELEETKIKAQKERERIENEAKEDLDRIIKEFQEGLLSLQKAEEEARQTIEEAQKKEQSQLQDKGLPQQPKNLNDFETDFDTLLAQFEYKSGNAQSTSKNNSKGEPPLIFTTNSASPSAYPSSASRSPAPPENVSDSVDNLLSKFM